MDNGIIKKTTKKDGTDENRHRTFRNGQEQAGISRETNNGEGPRRYSI